MFCAEPAAAEKEVVTFPSGKEHNPNFLGADRTAEAELADRSEVS